MTTTALVGLDGPLAGRRFDLGQGYLLVGRSPESGLHLNDPHVSRRHAGLIVEGFRAWVEDLGSTEGTFLNGEPVHGRRELRRGDVLRFAGVTMRVDGGGPSGAARFDVGGQIAAGSINNVAGHQIQYIQQQRESLLREVAAARTRGRWLIGFGFLLVVVGFAMFAGGILHFLSTVAHGIESGSTEPPSDLLGPDIFGVPSSLVGWALAALGSFLIIIGIVQHVVATARRRRVDRDLPLPRPYW